MAAELHHRALIGQLHQVGLVAEPGAIHILKEWLQTRLPSDPIDDEAVSAALVALVQQLRETAARRGTRALSEALLREVMIVWQDRFQDVLRSAVAGLNNSCKTAVTGSRWQLVSLLRLSETDLLNLPSVSERKQTLVHRYSVLLEDATRLLKLTSLIGDQARVFETWPTEIVPVHAVRTCAPQRRGLQTILGLLIARSADEWLAEDPSGTVALRMYPHDSETGDACHDCDAPRTIVCAGSFIIAIGSYDQAEDCFVVRELRPPPLTPNWHAEWLPSEELERSSGNDNVVRGQNTGPDHAALTPSPERPSQSPDSRLHQHSSAEKQTGIEAETASEGTRDNIDGTSMPDRGIEAETALDKSSANLSASVDTTDESLHVLIAGDLALDDTASYAKWRKLLRTIYAPSKSAVEPSLSATVSAEERVKSCPCPAPISPRCIFVLCGPFLRPRRHSWPPSTEEHAQGVWDGITDADLRWCTSDEKALLKAFRRFGKILAAFQAPLRASGSEFVLVPAESDLECFGDVLPRPPLASIFVDAMREHSGLRVEQIRAEMDPTRFQLQFEGRNPYSMFVHATETLSERLAADSLPWPPNCRQCQPAKSMQAYADAVFRTILHQRHIAPFPVHKQPIFWPLDRQCLWTQAKRDRFDDVIVIADTALPLHIQPYSLGGSASLSGGLTPSRALCIAPGSFGRDGTMVWVQVSSRGQRPPQAWPLYLLAEEPSENHSI